MSLRERTTRKEREEVSFRDQIKRFKRSIKEGDIIIVEDKDRYQCIMYILDILKWDNLSDIPLLFPPESHSHYTTKYLLNNSYVIDGSTFLIVDVTTDSMAVTVDFTGSNNNGDVVFIRINQVGGDVSITLEFNNILNGSDSNIIITTGGYTAGFVYVIDDSIGTGYWYKIS